MLKRNKIGRPTKPDKRTPFNLRLRSSLIAKIRNRADKERRPMNTVIEMILEDSL